MIKKKIVWFLEKRKIEDLKSHPKNPRVFTEKGMKDLGDSINAIGMAQPVNITKEGVILSGHARVLKLKEMGDDEVDVYVPNRKLTDKEQEEILVRMNANTAGQWDMDILANEFELPEIENWGLQIPDMDDDIQDGENEDSVEPQKAKITIECAEHEKEDIIDFINIKFKESSFIINIKNK